MPAYIVELPDEPGHGLFGGFNKMVVFAADTAGAIDAAQGEFDGDSSAMWGGATATEIVTETGITGHTLRASIIDASPLIDVLVEGPGIAVGAVALNDGGTATYVVDEILTAVGGTFTRAATFRIITVNTGVITAVELVDPGDYTVAPPTLTANPVTGGSGTVALLDLTMQTDGYEVLLGKLVTGLNADAQIADADIDLSEGAAGTRLLTVSSISDALGDLDLVINMSKNGSPNANLLSTVTDGGIAAAVLTVAIPASPIVFPRVIPVKG